MIPINPSASESSSSSSSLASFNSTAFSSTSLVSASTSSASSSILSSTPHQVSSLAMAQETKATSIFQFVYLDDLLTTPLSRKALYKQQILALRAPKPQKKSKPQATSAAPLTANRNPSISATTSSSGSSSSITANSSTSTSEKASVLSMFASSSLSLSLSPGEYLAEIILDDTTLTPDEKIELLSRPIKSKPDDDILNVNLLVYTLVSYPERMTDCMTKLLTLMEAMLQSRKDFASKIYQLLQTRYYILETVQIKNHRPVAMLRERIFCHSLAVLPSQSDQKHRLTLLKMIYHLAANNSREAFCLLLTRSPITGYTLGHIFANKNKPVFQEYLRTLQKLLINNIFSPTDIFVLRRVTSNSGVSLFRALMRTKGEKGVRISPEAYQLTAQQQRELLSRLEVKTAPTAPKTVQTLAHEQQSPQTTNPSTVKEEVEQDSKSPATTQAKDKETSVARTNNFSLDSSTSTNDVDSDDTSIFCAASEEKLDARKEALIDMHYLYLLCLQRAAAVGEATYPIPLLQLYSSFPENSPDHLFIHMSSAGLTPAFRHAMLQRCNFAWFEIPFNDITEFETFLEALVLQNSKVGLSNSPNTPTSSSTSSSSSSCSSSSASSLTTSMPYQQDPGLNNIYLGLSRIIENGAIQTFLAPSTTITTTTEDNHTNLTKILSLVDRLPTGYIYPLLSTRGINQNNLGMQICSYCDPQLLTTYLAFLLKFLEKNQLSPLQVLSTLFQCNHVGLTILLASPQKLVATNFLHLLQQLITKFEEANYPADFIFTIFTTKWFTSSNNMINALAGTGNHWYFNVDQVQFWLKRGISPTRLLALFCDVADDQNLESSAHAAGNSITYYSANQTDFPLRQQTSEKSILALTHLVTVQRIHPEIMFRALMLTKTKIGNNQYNFFQLCFMPWGQNFFMRYAKALAEFLCALNPSVGSPRGSFWVKNVIGQNNNEEQLELFWENYHPSRRGELLFELGKKGILLEGLDYSKDLLRYLGFGVTHFPKLFAYQLQCLDPNFYFGWWIGEAETTNVVIQMLAFALGLKELLLLKIQSILENDLKLSTSSSMYRDLREIFLNSIYVGHLRAAEDFIPCNWESNLETVCRTLQYNFSNFAKIVGIIQSTPNFLVNTSKTQIENQIKALRDSRTGAIKFETKSDADAKALSQEVAAIRKELESLGLQADTFTSQSATVQEQHEQEQHEALRQQRAEILQQQSAALGQKQKLRIQTEQQELAELKVSAQKLQEKVKTAAANPLQFVKVAIAQELAEQVELGKITQTMMDERLTRMVMGLTKKGTSYQDTEEQKVDPTQVREEKARQLAQQRQATFATFVEPSRRRKQVKNEDQPGQKMKEMVPLTLDHKLVESHGERSWLTASCAVSSNGSSSSSTSIDTSSSKSANDSKVNPPVLTPVLPYPRNYKFDFDDEEETSSSTSSASCTASSSTSSATPSSPKARSAPNPQMLDTTTAAMLGISLSAALSGSSSNSSAPSSDSSATKTPSSSSSITSLSTLTALG